MVNDCYYGSELYHEVKDFLTAKCERLEWYGDDECFCPPLSLFLECSYVSKQKPGWLHINTYEGAKREPRLAYEYVSRDKTCGMDYDQPFKDFDDFAKKFEREIECVFCFYIRREPHYEQMRLF